MSMPDSGLPRWARVIGRVGRASVYGLVAVVGWADLLRTSPVITDSITYPWVVVLAWAALVSGLVGLGAVVVWRWRWEWVATWAAATALGARAAAVWLTVDDDPLRLAPAAGITIAALACILRGFDLTVFAIRTSAAVLRARR